MSDQIAEANTRAAMTLVEALARLGLRHAVLSPGSRSTPLAIALAKNDTIETHIHFDERGAAFMAYGIGKATRMPAAAVCTSGTAVANYLPAAVEASNAGVPLLLITADRPPELQDCGANQTIHQPGIFGVYARWEKTLPCPDDGGPITDILATATEAMRHALTPPAGPVHLNCQYREPLAMPTDAAVALPPELDGWQPELEIETPTLSEGEFEALKLDLAGTKRGLIVVGSLDTREESMAVAKLGISWLWPLFADITSGLRVFEYTDTGAWEPHYDLGLISDRAKTILQPDTVVHFGGPIVSKRLQQHLETIKPERYIHVSPDPRRRDQGRIVTRRCHADIVQLVEALGMFNVLTSNVDEDDHIHDLLELVEEKLLEEDTSDENTIRSEWQLHRKIDPIVDPYKCPLLFLGNSMPVRNADMFSKCRGPFSRIYANRGASGIDGNIATVAGLAAAGNNGVIAVLGDLTFFHDVNSLALLRGLDRVCIIVPNNDGGGIFRYLPIGDRGDVFSPFFSTPHGMTLELIAAQFGMTYCRTNDAEKMNGCITDTFLHGTGNSIIEVPIDREANYSAHQKILEQVRAALDGESTT